MPITPHIESVARRTIEEIQDYYKNYSDDINDTDEMEHRIARVERLKEACNGLTEKDKLQKTAENLFEVGTAWERGQDLIKKIIKKNQSYVEKQFEEIQKQNAENYKNLQGSIDALSENMNKKFEEEKRYNEGHYESKVQMISTQEKEQSGNQSNGGIKGMIIKFVDNHFAGCLFGIILIVVLMFISGHTDLINQIISKF
jgi:hemerythrin-like domain-containing protein